MDCRRFGSEVPRSKSRSRKIRWLEIVRTPHHTLCVTEFHKIWIEQCDAAEGIRERFGTKDAARYLIGEKLMRAQSDNRHRTQSCRANGVRMQSWPPG